MSKETTSQTKSAKSQIAPDQIITIEIPWKEIKPLYDKAVANASKGLKVAGFRQGKVPPQIAKSKLDPEKIAQRTLQELLPAKYEAEIKTKKAQPLGQPEFIITTAGEGESWVVETHYAEAPEIKLKDYKKILKNAKTQAKKDLETTEKEKAAQAKKQAEEIKKAATKDKKEADKANTVELDPTLQPLTPEQIESRLADQAIIALRAEIAPVIPELLIKHQVQHQMQELVNQLKQYNIELDDYLKNTRTTFEQLATNMTEEALQKIQIDFLIKELIAAEKITATDAEIDQEFDTLFKQEETNHAGHEDHADREGHTSHEHKHDHSPDQARKDQLKKDAYYRQYITDLIQRRKLVEFLKAL